MYPIFAITTRGIETLAENELAQQHNVAIRQIAYRRVHAIAGMAGLHFLRACRTVDDIFVEVATWENIRHTRDMLPEFVERSGELHLEEAIRALQMVRRIPEYPRRFSVTASFVGKRNYSYHEIKAALAEGISAAYSAWTYTDDDRDAHLNLRLIIEHDAALVGLRLFQSPLHRRAYKQASLEGSLKPPVAAAMIQLAGLRKGQILLDPFCGSGTIAIEAAQQGVRAIVGDVNLDALTVTQANAKRANTTIGVAQWDANTLPLAHHRANAVVSNLPWGRQIVVDESLRALYERTYAEMVRVCDGRIVLLTTETDLLPDTPLQMLEVSVHGQNPTICVFESSDKMGMLEPIPV